MAKLVLFQENARLSKGPARSQNGLSRGWTRLRDDPWETRMENHPAFPLKMVIFQSYPLVMTCYHRWPIDG